MNRLLALAAVVALLAAPAAGGAQTASDQNAAEDQIGRQVYAQLQQKGEILSANHPYYAVLRPIAAQIKRVADPQYYRPFTFVLVHEAQPNAFAVPGGNVYVTDSLIKFVENREELAGVLCHETSHDIHHDVIHNIARDQAAQQRVTIGALLIDAVTGGRASGIVNGLANIDLMTVTNKYSREVETAADLKGADTCAQAGSNPHGMVWLFERFEKNSAGGGMEMLSDHPTDDHRIEDLHAHFAANPQLFGRFSSNLANATPLSRPRVAEDAAPAGG